MSERYVKCRVGEEGYHSRAGYSEGNAEVDYIDE